MLHGPSKGGTVKMTVSDGGRRKGGHDGGAAGVRAPFPRYWLSKFLADFGDGVRLAALPLLAAKLTRSPAAVAAVTTVQSLPWLTGAWLGVIVDRTDRRRLMVVVDATRAAIIAALAGAILVHADGLALIYLTAFTTGAGSALRNTAAAACVPRLVDSADLDRANGRLIAGQIVANELAGPAAGGWLFGLAAVLPFAVNAGALGIAVLLLLTLPSVFQPAGQPAQHDPARTRATVRQDLAEGLAWLRRHSEIRDLTIAVGVISAMDAAWIAVLVLYVSQILHQKPGAYGALLAVSAVGGIAAGAIGSRLTRRLGMWPVLLLAGLAMAASQLVLGLTANVLIAAPMLAASSAAWALFDMTAVTMRQRLVPDRLLGRVTSLYGTVFGGAEAVGALAGGALATAAGIRSTMLVGAMPIAAVTIVTAWRHRTA
jgi:predicted MFS family arabinose efflux permease